MRCEITDKIEYRECSNCYTSFIYDKDTDAYKRNDDSKFKMIDCPHCGKSMMAEYGITLKFLIDR